MEATNTFNGGINRHYNPISQPKDTYRDARNILRRGDGSILLEKGLQVINSLPVNYTIVGSYVLEDEVIYFLNSGSQSEIGVFKDNTYTPILNSNELNFNISSPIDVQGRKDYRGHRIIYFTDNLNPIRRLDLDDIPQIELSNSMDLFLNSDLIYIDYVNTLDSGELNTGVYQFAARLLTQEGNATSFGLITNPIPVIDEGAVTYHLRDGDEINGVANKAIVLDIKNIDLKYKFIELAVITYKGISNTPTINLLRKIAITDATQRFVYSSENQITGDSTLDELTIEQVNYSRAKHIEQKDGRLLISSLQSDDDEFDFQAVANNIISKYTFKTLFKTEVIYINNTNNTTQDTGSMSSNNDYDKEETTVYHKSLRRSEVYSFALVPIFKNGSTGNAYHIPPRYATSTIEAEPVTKDTGVYVSELYYPKSKGFPSEDGDGTTKIRFHKMPSIEQEPLVIQSNGFTSTTHTLEQASTVVLGMNFSNIIFPNNIKEKLAGYIIVRQNRDDANKSILQQGFAFKMNHTSPGDHNGNEGQLFNRYKDNQQAMIIHPLFNGSVAYKNVTRFGVPNQNSDVGTGRADRENWHILNNLVAFYSPETIFYDENPLKGNSYLYPEIIYQGYGKSVQGDFSDGGNGNLMSVFFNYTGLKIQPNKQKAFIEYSKFIEKDNLPIDGDINKRKGRPFLTLNDLTYPYKRVSNSNTLGFWLLKTTSNIVDQENSITYQGYPNINFNPTYKKQYMVDLDGNEDNSGRNFQVYLRRRDNNAWYNVNSAGMKPQVEPINQIENTIYNVRRDLPQQYGNLTDAEYIYVTHKLLSGDMSDTNIDCFNGDTFINKFAFMTSAILTALPFNYVGASTVDDGILANRNLFYAYLESSINTKYRHFTEDMVGYYPKVKDITNGSSGLFDYLPSVGQGGRAYNKQYSFNNTLKKYFPAHLTTEVVNNFSNRTIYSEQSIEGEQFDAYRLFLINNYHDIPRHKGEITDTFVYNDTFYIQTAYALFRSFFNQETAITSQDSRTVVLGNGGLFPIPSKEMFTVAGGYCGTTSKWSGCNTPFGRFFLDTIQGKVFILTDTVTEISEQGLYRFFLEKLDKVNDNFSENSGYISCFDYENKRWLLSKLGENGFTISYQVQLQSFTAEHDYIPYHMVQTNKRVYIHNYGDNNIYELNKGNIGEYFNNTYHKAYIRLVVNDNPKVNKTFDNVILTAYNSSNVLTDEDKDNLYLKEDIFTHIQVYNSNQNSGLRKLVSKDKSYINYDELEYDEVNKEYRIQMPTDWVIDPTVNIFEETNLEGVVNPLEVLDKILPRFKDHFMVIELQYDNKNNTDKNINLFAVTTIYRVNKR